MSWRTAATVRWREKFRAPDGWALPIAALPALVLSVPLLKTPPLSYDHATHLFKAWHFWEEMLGRGRLRGWSHFWAFGFPSDELVPCGSEVWVALFRAMTFAQLSWLSTYALAFAGFLIFKTLASYWFARCFFGPAASIACAWIVTLDPGGMLEGGWTWHTYWGVWPVSLAMSFFQLSLVRMVRVLDGGSARHVFAAGAWLFAALMTHQMALPAAAIVVPLMIFDRWLKPGQLTCMNFARVVLAAIFGFALSASFLVPFLARGNHTQDLGWLGESLPVVSQKFVELRTFQNLWVPVHGFALLGAWWALRRRIPGGVFLVAAGGVLVVLASGTLLRDLHLERVMPSLTKLEANRFLLVAKLFWFPLAGHGFVRLTGPWVSRLRQLTGNRRAALRWGAGTALAAALLIPGYRAFYDTQIAKNIVGADERKFWKDFPALLEWSRGQRQSSAEHYRIAYHMWRGEHLSTLAPVFDATPMYKVGYTPTQIYNKIPTTDETALLEALSVKYVVSTSRLVQPTLELERRFGQLWLYRFNRYRPEPFTVAGPGSAELLEFSPERVRIRLKGTTAESRIKLHVASFDRWQASVAGRTLPIWTVPVFGVEYPMLMEVPGVDGELVLEYVYRAVDWLGLAMTLAAVPAFLGCWWLQRRHQVSSLICGRAARAARPILTACAIGSLAVILYVALASRSRARLLPRQSIFHAIQSPAEMSLGGHPCNEVASLSFVCGPNRLKADVVAGEWGLHLCMTAPSDAGPLQVRARTTLGSFLAAHYDPESNSTGRIRVEVDGRELATLDTRPSFLRHQQLKFDTRSLGGQPATVGVTLTGAALHCFDLTVEP